MRIARANLGNLACTVNDPRELGCPPPKLGCFSSERMIIFASRFSPIMLVCSLKHGASQLGKSDYSCVDNALDIDYEHSIPLYAVISWVRREGFSPESALVSEEK
jgi:hypothetical protein